MSSNPVFPVRTATLREAKIITDIHAAASSVALKNLVSADGLKALSAGRGMAYWRDAIEYGEPQVHVATEGDQVVGFVGFDRSRDKGTPPTMGEVHLRYPDLLG